MGLTDKVKKGFDSVAKKTNDAIDVSSLKSKINEENRNIEDKKKEIGEKYYSKHSDGKDIEPYLKDEFGSIEGSLKKIKEYEEEIAKIKDDGSEDKKD